MRKVTHWVWRLALRLFACAKDYGETEGWTLLIFQSYLHSISVVKLSRNLRQNFFFQAKKFEAKIFFKPKNLRREFFFKPKNFSQAEKLNHVRKVTHWSWRLALRLFAIAKDYAEAKGWTKLISSSYIYLNSVVKLSRNWRRKFFFKPRNLRRKFFSSQKNLRRKFFLSPKIFFKSRNWPTWGKLPTEVEG